MESFDYIIVGAGAAGCVLASRLSQSGRHSVLLLEAGGKPSGMWIDIPAGFARLMVSPRFNWTFETEADDIEPARKIAVPRGKGLGGSTLINGMIYVRGQRHDYDAWARAGAAGWSAAEVQPYFARLESFDGPDPDGLRGRNGPMHITTVTERHELASAYLEAARQGGLAPNADYNGEEQSGAGYYQVLQHGGRRWSAFDGYLKPAMGRRNLEVRTGAHVTRLLADNSRITGLRYRRDGGETSVGATGEVILAAGSVQTPQLLELSGIGDPSWLAGLGIDVVAPIPQVGENLADHFATRMNWQVTGTRTLNETSRLPHLLGEILKYGLRSRGMLTLGTGMGFGFAKTHPGLATPDIQFFFVPASYANAADRQLDIWPGMTIGVAQLRPQSRGSIHIASGDPLDPPSIRPNYLAAEEDRRSLIAGMRLAREIVGQRAMARFRPVERSAGPEVQSDDEFLGFALATGQTIYHPVGTCRMGSDAGAVVDPRLRCRGIAGLRIVDASIMPSIVSGNTQAAVMMIAEKAADMIAENACNA